MYLTWPPQFKTFQPDELKQAKDLTMAKVKTLFGSYAEDVAFAVARWVARGGAFMNYYMYFGGQHHEASAAAGEPLQTKSLVADIIGAEDTTLQQRRFMLHAKKGWKSALEIVVEHEIHVLKDVPIFFRLIDAKWKAFGRRYHVTYTVLPYLFFFVCFNTGLLLRCFDIEEAFYNLNADGKPVKPLNLTRTVAAISSSLSSGQRLHHVLAMLEWC